MKRAFSLIEAIVAIGVFSIGILTVASFFAGSAPLSHHASSESIASNLAQGYLDHQLSLSYEDSQVGQSAKTRVSGDSTNPFYNYYEEESISLIDADLNQSATDVGLKKIQVVISYQEGNQQKNVTLATIKTKK